MTAGHAARARRRLTLAMSLTLMTLVVGCATSGGSSPTTRATPTGPTGSAAATATPTATAIASVGPAATPFPLTAFPEAATDALPAGVAKRLQAVLDGAVGDETRVGIASAVIVGGEGIWSGLAGNDLAGKLVTDQTRWNTGSIGKTVVSAEIQRLVERGELALDTPASDVIDPGRRVNTNGATVGDLLRMRSGISSGQQPGTVWEYSNGDYVILGHVIEGAEHHALGDVLTDDILDVPGVAGLKFPAGGNVSNAAGPLETDALSLARWGYALFGGSLLEPPSLARMVAFDENTYGMGVFDFSADFGRPAAGHGGQDGSWSATLVAQPEQHTVIVVLMNQPDFFRTHGEAVDLARAVGD